MKHFYLIGIAAVALAMGACSNDYTDKQTQELPALNIITNISDGTTVASEGTYTFDYTLTSETQYGTISTSNLLVNNNSVSFSTETTYYETKSPFDAYFNNPQIQNANITDASFLVAPMLNPYYGIYVNSISGSFTYRDNYKVTIIPRVPCFVGNTTTTYPQSEEPYKTTDIKYQLIFDTKETPNTASLIMYDAKFSGIPQEPVKSQIVLKDLNVEYSQDGIQVYGQNVIPLIPEGTELTPNEKFMVNSIEFKTTNSSFTKCTIQYQVAGIYNGSFEGQDLQSTFIK